MKYEIEIFTSRNTAIREPIPHAKDFLGVRLLAQDQSRYEKFPVIAREGEYPTANWVKYEKGKVTEASDLKYF